jgi:hypothetical protein
VGVFKETSRPDGVGGLIISIYVFLLSESSLSRGGGDGADGLWEGRISDRTDAQRITRLRVLRLVAKPLICHECGMHRCEKGAGHLFAVVARRLLGEYAGNSF